MHPGLEEIAEVAELPGGEPLQVPIVRAQAIVLADHMEQPQKALAVIDHALSVADGYARFLLHYTAGSLLLDHSTPEAALGRYQLALAESPTVESFLCFDALQRGAEAAARSGQWQLSRDFAIRALKCSQEKEVLYEFLEMLGELAWAYWRLGNHRKAWGAMAGIVRRLVQNQDFENRRFREVFGKTGHVLGWMASMAKSGSPPIHTIDGQPYTEPFPGFFSRPRPQLADLPLSPLFHVLFTQLAMFADGCGLYELALRTLTQANRLAENKSFFQYVNYLSLAELVVRKERYKEALQFAIPGIHVTSASRLFRDSNFNFLTTQISPEDFWNSLSDEQRRDAEHNLYGVIIGPAIARLLAKGAPLKSYAAVIAELETIFRQSENELVDLQYWLDTFRELRIAFSPIATRETIREQIQSLSEGGLRLLPFYLALSRMLEVSLSESCGAQIVTFDYLLRALPASKLMAEDISVYVLGYWRKIAETQAFALRNPQAFRKELQLIERPTFSNVATLLLLAADATGVRLSNELRQSLADAGLFSTS